jgi:hypothetical protein
LGEADPVTGEINASFLTGDAAFGLVNIAVGPINLGAGMETVSVDGKTLESSEIIERSPIVPLESVTPSASIVRKEGSDEVVLLTVKPEPAGGRSLGDALLTELRRFACNTASGGGEKLCALESLCC